MPWFPEVLTSVEVMGGHYFWKNMLLFRCLQSQIFQNAKYPPAPTDSSSFAIESNVMRVAVYLGVYIWIWKLKFSHQVLEVIDIQDSWLLLESFAFTWGTVYHWPRCFYSNMFQLKEFLKFPQDVQAFVLSLHMTSRLGMGMLGKAPDFMTC